MSRRLRFGRLAVYLEPRDVAPGAVYVCPLPLLVLRWTRTATTREDTSR